MRPTSIRTRSHNMSRARSSASRPAAGWKISSNAGGGISGSSSSRNRLYQKSGIFRLMGTALFAATQKPLSGPGGLKRLQQCGHSQDVNHPFEIVAQHAQRQFRFGFSQPAQQEPGMGHQPLH